MLLVACTAETTCRKDMAVAMVLTLQADSINQKGHTVKYTSWDSITVELLGEYNLLFDNGKGISKLPMPLLPDTTISTFLTATVCAASDLPAARSVPW